MRLAMDASSVVHSVRSVGVESTLSTMAAPWSGGIE
jgi:hypothetical protein